MSSTAQKGNAIVLFCDLMGFTESIKQNWKDSEKFISEIIRMKDHVETFDYVKVVVRGEDYKPDAKVDLLSDSFVLTFFMSEDGQGLTQGFLSAAIAVQILSETAADHGYAVRGGVDYGPIYRDGKHLIGPALGRAYVCESQAACDIRVVLGSHLIDEIISVAPADFAPFSWATYVGSDGKIAFKSKYAGSILNKISKIRDKSPENLRSRYRDFFDHDLQDSAAIKSRAAWENGRDIMLDFSSKTA